MIRLFTYLLLSLALVSGLAIVLSTPGSVLLTFGEWTLQPSLAVATLTLTALFLVLLFTLWLLRRIFAIPAALANAQKRASERSAVQALSNSLIALESGDAQRAKSLAQEAGNRLADPTAAKLLEARANLKLNQWSEARDGYKNLLEDERTSVAALSGLYDQALAQNRPDAAIRFAQEAHAKSPSLPWASREVFAQLAQSEDWEGAIAHIEAEQAKNKKQREDKNHRLAVAHTALASQWEDSDPPNALSHAQTALKLHPNFIPAALIASRLFSANSEVRKASSLLKRVWRQTSHPHLAILYAHAQTGASAQTRLDRIKELIPVPAPDATSALCVAQIAVEAQDYVMARNVLAGFSTADPTRDICLAMAKIEEGQNQDFGRAREWLSKAVSAPADKAWTADGTTLEAWQPLSPVSKNFDAVEWKVPVTAPAAPTGFAFSEQEEASAEIADESNEQ